MTVEALRGRRPDVLADLLELHGREIQSVAYLILRDRADAEDVLVETLITALAHGQDLRDGTALRAWLLRIATNHALGLRRTNRRIVRLAVVPEIVGAPDPGIEAVGRIALLDGVADLPPQMRAAVVLRYYADLSVDDVAAALGKSPNTIKAQLQVALDRLRITLADQRGTSLREANHA
jgi:RNA polymerase sigma-70 factor (ECF subfamily)